ncbi:MAG: phosphate ABC transporter permease subunit PstC [Treponema phagedenis]|uniref:Phosphate transport system permease protein n=1 Tax=Treponema phagedenis TaxID=162 RepID=A0A0B7GQL2_TREPH|nr:phosphate ABC transporter permease subunit PstC [Treponema phagedenis]CEM60879.1 putative ABC transporter permease protein YqgH [Treponema phagedenis]
MNRKTIFEKIVRGALFASALLSIAAVLFISLFLFYRGLPLFKTVRVADFLFSSTWEPTAENPSYGILSFIIGSFYVTGLSLLIAVPIGLAAGAYLAELSGEKNGRIVRSAVELLAGVPSVVYGLFGIALITRVSRFLFGGSGFNIASASAVLAIMILPTIINVTEISLRSVNPLLKENSLALGATRWQTLKSVLMPAANKGIIAGVVLAMGRAMGETMAVLMVGGNAPIMPTQLNGMVRTLTMNIITDMSYATGDHLTSLFTTGIVLFIFIVLLNLTVQIIFKKSMEMK